MGRGGGEKKYILFLKKRREGRKSISVHYREKRKEKGCDMILTYIGKAKPPLRKKRAKRLT